MMLNLGLSLDEGKHEYPGVIFDLVTLHNNSTRKENDRDDDEEDE